MKFSLRSKILVLFIAVALVPLAVLAALGVYFINIAQEQSVARLEAQLLAHKEKEIEKFVAETQSLLRVQVTGQVAALSGVPQDQREYLLAEIVKSNRYITALALLEYDPTYPNKPEAGMELSKIAGGQIAADLVSRRSSAEFQTVIAGTDYVGPVTQKGDDFFMSVAAPVRNKDGVVIGAVAGEVSLAPVVRFVGEGTLGNAGYLFLTDARGVIWAKPQRLSFQGFGSHVYAQSVLGGEKGAMRGTTEEYASSFGDRVVASAHKIRGLGWVLVAEWPKNDAYEVVYTIMRQAAVFCALILGVAVIASILLAGRIIRPVRTLAEGARIIGDGNLDHRIVIRTSDELEALAGQFNEMAKNLKDIEELREIKARVLGLATSLEKEKELSQVKDQFIATASHQLRTPVSVIRWMTEGLASGIASGAKDDIAAQLKDLARNVEALALVIGDILTVAELGIGYAPRTVAEFSLLEQAKEAIKKLTAEAAEKNITIALDAGEGEYRVKASAMNIARAIEHLLGNAIAYTKENGHIVIALSARTDAVTFSVTDDGIGVSKEDQKFLFGEFFRGRNSVEMKNVGTGLGLFIVKTIIEGHDGTVGVESPADWSGKKAGSRFYFSLPL